LSQYFTSDFEHPMSNDDLRDAASDTQSDVMRTWFYQNYEVRLQRETAGFRP